MSRKLNIRLTGYADAAMNARHIAYCQSLCLPGLSRATKRRLAVVGGGPSVERHVDALQGWDGDTWAVNGAYEWCRGHAIDAWFFTVDPSPFVIAAGKCAGRAILSTTSHPDLLDLFKDRHVEVYTPRMLGPTTAVEAATVALDKGYDEVTYFGCEGSYRLDWPNIASHAYPEDRAANITLEVDVAGTRYLTQPDFLEQTRTLAGVIRGAPLVFKEQSGGMLSAMVEHGDEYKATAMWMAQAKEVVNAR